MERLFVTLDSLPTSTSLQGFEGTKCDFFVCHTSLVANKHLPQRMFRLDLGRSLPAPNKGGYDPKHLVALGCTNKAGYNLKNLLSTST